MRVIGYWKGTLPNNTDYGWADTQNHNPSLMADSHRACTIVTESTGTSVSPHSYSKEGVVGVCDMREKTFK